MQRNFIKIITVILVLLYGNIVLANGILQYYISQKKVETARVVDKKDGYYAVVIKLKEPYKEEFTKLTAKNIGRKLQILFKRQVLVEARIQEKIPSGIITVGEWKSAEEALMFIETLQNNNVK